MSLLVTSDIHLSDHPLEEYRWGLLLWLAAMAHKKKVEAVLILGDLTVAKDKHSAVLVNRLVEGMLEIAKQADLFILKANHDYQDEDWPFFGFLDRYESIRFITKPSEADWGGKPVLLLPHTRNYEADWEPYKWNNYGLIFCHQTFDGATAENGVELRGVPPSVFAGFKGQVWSGDIHVPQMINKTIGYVGSPYRVHFGDAYQPRVLLLDAHGRGEDLKYPCLYRHVFDVSSHEELVPLLGRQTNPGDQVKVRVHLRRSEFAEWGHIRTEIAAHVAEAEVVPCGIELKTEPEKQRITSKNVGVAKLSKPLEIFDEYSDERDLSKGLRTVGKDVLKEVL